MKSKSVLIMLELLIMIFVFLFISAVCFRVFVASDRISHESSVRDGAVILAQNAGEILKATNGNISAVNEYLSKNIQNGKYDVKIAEIDDSQTLLGKARITVNYENDEVLSITVCWQEVQENE